MADRSKQTITVADLAAVEKELRRRLATIKGIKAAFEEFDANEIEVNGTRSLSRAYKFVDTFLLSCKKELGEL